MNAAIGLSLLAGLIVALAQATIPRMPNAAMWVAASGVNRMGREASWWAVVSTLAAAGAGAAAGALVGGAAVQAVDVPIGVAGC